MKVSELADLAEQVLEFHRGNLLVDPFFRITIEITEGDFISKCVKDDSPLSWKIILHPGRHRGWVDVQYSIVESLLAVLFDGVENDRLPGVIARLSTAICNVYAEADDES